MVYMISPASKEIHESLFSMEKWSSGGKWSSQPPKAHNTEVFVGVFFLTEEERDRGNGRGPRRFWVEPEIHMYILIMNPASSMSLLFHHVIIGGTIEKRRWYHRYSSVKHC